MDKFNYIILLLVFLMIVFTTLIIDYKTKYKKIGIMVSLVCLIGCAIIFGLYIRAIYFLPTTSEGKAMTFIMRTFMLDDNILDSKNITTGFITLSVLMVDCIAFFSYFIIRYIICKRRTDAIQAHYQSKEFRIYPMPMDYEAIEHRSFMEAMDELREERERREKEEADKQK